ncbi:MAG: Release factor glutamine methyltransferase [Pseudomonadota bacterium]
MISMTARIVVFGAIVSLALALANPSAVLAQADETWRPQRGQTGKDVMWLPTPDELAYRLLEVARVGPNDLVYDLGAGDGKIAIAAAQRHGARAVGIEYNARLAAFAQREVERAGVADRVRIIQADLFQTDFSSATVLTLYLLDELNQQLRPRVLAMKPGTRVVSNSFAMGDWEPDHVVRVGTQVGYYWLVPANVAGEWIVEGLAETSGPARLALVQRYQRLAGTITIDGRALPLLSPAIEGDRLSLRYVDASNLLKAVRLTVQADRLEGEMVPPYGMVESIVERIAVRGRRTGGKP